MKRTLKLKLHTQWDKYEKEFRFMFWRTDMSEQGYAYIKDVDLEIECPDDAELTAIVVRVMNAEIAAKRAQSVQLFLRMEEEVAELLALEHKPS